MKTGIELITEERNEQLTKHGRSVPDDVRLNDGVYKIEDEVMNNPQLTHAARQLISNDEDILREYMDEEIFRPFGWDKSVWHKMAHKPYKERLIIAAALIAAEIDRIQYTDKSQPK